MKALAGMVVLTATLLAGCESGDIKKAKADVSNELRDPSSAEFRNINEIKKTSVLELEVVTVCGEVNGKNAYGGYVGFQRFVSQPKSDRVYLENSWNTFDSLWSRHCSDA
ncbi:hypothetical protein NDQ72_06345 [Halomonas sp. KG2]|uniref:hypothetical protein n=1 Tax=Halomonas sp. KG2 TaxID=2951138 RepID=UPI00264A1B92|nr:hypothetical protein [Halomonas sp. KG2]WKD29560.1 hypothetical protein NDQ72_06345 [Halomonas sp. KG2]